MKRGRQIIVLTLGFFVLYWVLDALFFGQFRAAINELVGQGGTSHIIAYTFSSIPILIGIWTIHGNWHFHKYLGLDGNMGKAVIFSVLCTAPMFFGFWLLYEFDSEVTLNSILISVVAAGFFEEVFYRGFLFGQLFRYTKLGFIPAVFLGALLFGLLHLYQSNDPLTALGIFSITFLGSVLFSWLYIEWNNNLWVPIFAHALMNLSWTLFSVDTDALGGWYANIFRFTTIFLFIVVTIYIKSCRGEGVRINRSSLWMERHD